MTERSENNPSPAKSMQFKLKAAFALILALTVYISTQLFDTAVIKAEYYRAKANNQQLRPFTINANRGTIYDRNGKILAQSKTVWTVILSPSAIWKNKEVYQTQREIAAMNEYHKNINDGLPAYLPVSGIVYDEAEEICRALADIFELDYEKLLKTCQDSELGYEIVVKKVEKAEIDKLDEFKKEKGIGTYSVYKIEDTKRLYPNGYLAANVIGFTNYDNIGIYGIEAQYDDYLKGVDGLFVMAKDAYNQAMPYDYEMRYEAQNGNSLILTIDEVLQHYLEKNLEIAVSQHKPENRATGIIMNANTGAVLAMATYPSFDLNEPSTLSDLDYQKLEDIRQEKINDTLILSGFEIGTEADLTSEQVEKINSDIDIMRSVMRETQWKNKAISELYFPGSVFKVITCASALEEHVVGLNTGFYCPGHVIEGGEKINCWSTGGHGQIANLTEAITKSCNPSFVSIGKLLGVERFSDYFDAFGFTKKTGIDLPGESAPYFHKRENMGIVDLAVSSFGQANKITPLQMITAYAAAINGGYLVTPYVVDKIIDNDGNVIQSTQPNVKRQVISEETSALMRQILEDVVEVNRENNAYIAGYRIGGKSGTSQKIDHPDYGEGHELYVGSFCAFTPANDPEIVMLVIVDQPTGGSYYGSAVAAPVVSAVFKETLPYLEIYPSQMSEEELAMQDTVVPYLKDMTETEALNKLAEAGLTANFQGLGSGNRVLYTVPQGGQPIAPNGTVVVYMAEEEYNMSTVPNVYGLSPAKVNEVMTNAGLNVKLTGTIYSDRATAYSQSLPEGTKVASGTVIEVKFIFVDGYAG
ncbi:MAG: penicillin-binding transpeptidase domain-containing protein [Oscillospiraceae bacterium]|nr:penicillin-binding transpeptidase domain-containing protein [Oscillospiraceae bacterium]